MKSSPGAETRIGWVEQLHRYPVKSMRGERLLVADVDSRGLRYDRLWATRGSTGKLGSGKSTRRFQRIDGIELASARCVGDVPEMDFLDGVTCRGDSPDIDQVLRSVFGQPVTFCRENTNSHFDDGPVHLVVDASIRRVEESARVSIDPARLRANILVRADPSGGFPGLDENTLLRKRIRIGRQVSLTVLDRMRRCGMVNAATGDLPHDSRVLKAITRFNAMVLGVSASVHQEGTIAVGDEVHIVSGAR